MNLIVNDFKNPVELGNARHSMEFYPIRGDGKDKRADALAKFQVQFSWLDTATLWYHVPTATLFVPACYRGAKHD